MSFEKYIERFRHIDSLINKKATGDTKCLAKKLGLSRSATLEYLREMKELGFPIKYCKKRRSYYYEEEGKNEIAISNNISMNLYEKLCLPFFNIFF